MASPNPLTSAATSSPVGGLCPAYVVADPDTAALRVAGLTTLDRLLVAAHRAGLAPLTVVATQELPPIPRTRAWRIPFQVVSAADPAGGRAVWLRTDALVQAVDLKRLAAAGSARLTDAEGVGVLAVSVPKGWAGGDPFREAEGTAPLRAEGVACVVRNAGEARRATRCLWASIRSSADGTVDRWFNRPVGRPLARLLIPTPVTPNMISVAATLLGLVSAAMFAVGNPAWSVIAAVLFQGSAILDCVDGDVARVAFKESPLGKWLDLVGDQVVHIGVFLGITAGVMRSGGGAHMAWLGALAVVGAAMSFWRVLRGMRRPPEAGGSGRLQGLIDAATNRDFSVLVLILAILGRLEVFLWLAGLGSHVFWMLLAWLQREPRPVAGRS
ncbi:MAG: CDP-alcohol phosphatidyltransferase family protein [Verrucomicrobiales bacterium]|nr:CDP-alcohol phosphatidyltransferase family protein [Verrucomicrobiales bacterium]